MEVLEGRSRRCVERYLRSLRGGAVGYAERVINKFKVIKRRADALPTFTGLRDRILLACG